MTAKKSRVSGVLRRMVTQTVPKTRKEPTGATRNEAMRKPRTRANAEA